nr:leucine-rich repeat extensin-like protein 3 [Coffea arabica]
MKRNILVVTLIALVFVNSSFAEYSRNHPKDNHTKLSPQEEDQELRSARRRNRVGSRRRSSGGSRRDRNRGRRSRGSSNCGPLYSYLFGSCGKWPFSRSYGNNPFLPRPTPSPRPTLSWPPIMQPSPPLPPLIPLQPLLLSSPPLVVLPPLLIPSPPAISLPPPVVPSPPLVQLSSPPVSPSPSPPPPAIPFSHPPSPSPPPFTIATSALITTTFGPIATPIFTIPSFS